MRARVRSIPGVGRSHPAPYIERRELILNGKPWGATGAYEKLVGKVDFALDPRLPQNQRLVDLHLAPANSQVRVEFSADFFLSRPGRRDGHRAG